MLVLLALAAFGGSAVQEGPCLYGPSVGAVTATQATVWCYASPASVAAEYRPVGGSTWTVLGSLDTTTISKSEDTQDAERASAESSAASCGTATGYRFPGPAVRWVLPCLSAGTAYEFVIFDANAPTTKTNPRSFTTAPTASGDVTIDVVADFYSAGATSSGVGKNPAVAIAADHPAVLLEIGDRSHANPGSATVLSPAADRTMWRSCEGGQTGSEPEAASGLYWHNDIEGASTGVALPVEQVWDDHDYATDNATGWHVYQPVAFDVFREFSTTYTAPGNGPDGRGIATGQTKTVGYGDWTLTAPTGKAWAQGERVRIAPYATTTSTTSVNTTTGSKTFTVAASGLDFYVGGRVDAQSNTTRTKFVDGLVTSYSGTTLVVNVDSAPNVGSSSDWTITSVVPQAAYMDGRVKAYDAVSGALTVAVDYSAGTGTFSSWDIRANRGVWESFAWGPDVGVFMVDDRFGRTLEPTGNPATSPTNEANDYGMIDAQQEAALLSWLSAEQAAAVRWKIIASGSCGLGGDYRHGSNTGGKGDSWGSYMGQAQTIQDYVAVHGITGVVSVCGDKHSVGLLDDGDPLGLGPDPMLLAGSTGWPEMSVPPFDIDLPSSDGTLRCTPPGTVPACGSWDVSAGPEVHPHAGYGKISVTSTGLTLEVLDWSGSSRASYFIANP